MPIDNVADLIAETLIQAGVKRIFGVVGDSLNGLTEALRKRRRIDWIHVRHEEVAAFAAAGEAQIAGELAVCAGSCGPGNLHLINGLFDAHRSRTPVLAIAAQIPSGEIGGGYFQETHPQNYSGNAVTIASWFPIRRSFPMCWKMPSARPSESAASPCWSSPATLRCARRPGAAFHPMPGCCPATPVVRPAETELTALADLLNGRRRVTLFCGRGCAGSHAQPDASSPRFSKARSCTRSAARTMSNTTIPMTSA
jgi:pyruvate dehydrogenase (quinone)